MSGHARSASLRLARWVALGLLAGALAPAAASAASTVSLDPATNTVTLVGGPEDNHVNTGGGLFMTMITDSAGIVAGPGCDRSSDTQASCGRYAVLNADLGAGNDTLGTLLGPGTIGVVHGGPGNDTVYGDGGNSTVYGDEGNDNLSGGSGDDVVDGGPGFDQIFGDGAYLEPGSDGNDTINARDGGPDEVTCGFGWDSVVADAADRTGSECDQVDRGAAPTPTPTPTPTPKPTPTPTATPMSMTLTAPGRVKLATVLRSGYVFRCRFSTGGTFRAEMVLPAAQARRLHLGKRSVTLAVARGRVDGGLYRVTLRVAKARHRAALRHAGSTTVQVAAAAIDAQGRTDADGRTVRLTR